MRNVCSFKVLGTTNSGKGHFFTVPGQLVSTTEYVYWSVVRRTVAQGRESSAAAGVQRGGTAKNVKKKWKHNYEDNTSLVASTAVVLRGQPGAAQKCACDG